MRIAVIAIFVWNRDASSRVNSILHEYSELIMGRQGIPLHEEGISVISIIIKASNDTISALSGQLGKIDGVQVKAVYAKQEEK